MQKILQLFTIVSFGLLMACSPQVTEPLLAPGNHVAELTFTQNVNQAVPETAVETSPPNKIIRCFSTIELNEGPVVVIDGEFYDKETLGRLRPAHIKSIEHFEGVIASALFGEQGRQHGAVIVELTNKARRSLNLTD